MFRTDTFRQLIENQKINPHPPPMHPTIFRRNFLLLDFRDMNHRILLFSLLLCALTARISAQSSTGFIETLSTSSFLNTAPQALLITEDSCYLVAGQAYTQGNMVSTLTKVAGDGSLIWSQQYGDATHRISVKSVAPAAENGFMMSVAFDSANVVNHLALVRVDSAGQMLWARKYHDPSFIQWDGQTIRQTRDGGYIITGAKLGNTYTMAALKTDSLGVVQWSQHYCLGNNKDRSYDIRELPDSGFVLCGKSTEYNPNMTAEGIYVLRIDKNGNPLWGKGFGSQTAYPFELELTSDGGIVVMGFSIGTGFGNSDVVLLKLDTTGALQWMHVYGTSSSQIGLSFDILPNGNFAIAGAQTNPLNGQQEGMLLIADPAGNLIGTWQYPIAEMSSADRVIATPDSAILIAGSSPNAQFTSFSTVLVKTDLSGNVYCGAVTLPFGDSLYVPVETSGFTVGSGGTMFYGIEKYDNPIPFAVQLQCANGADFYTLNASPCANTPLMFINVSGSTSTAYWYVNNSLTDSTFNFTYTFSSAGTYTVTLITQAPADTSQMMITVLPSPVVTVTLPDTICNDLQYFGIWNHFAPWGGTFTTVFGSDTTLYPSIMQTGYSPITYSYTDGNGCNTAVTTAIYIDSCFTGLAEHDPSQATIFYDAGNNQLNLSFTKDASRQLQLFNATGQLVLSTNMRGTNAQWPLHDLPPGMYVLHVASGNVEASYRFIVPAR